MSGQARSIDTEIPSVTAGPPQNPGSIPDPEPVDPKMQAEAEQILAGQGTKYVGTEFKVVLAMNWYDYYDSIAGVVLKVQLPKAIVLPLGTPVFAPQGEGSTKMPESVGLDRTVSPDDVFWVHIRDGRIISILPATAVQTAEGQ